MADNLGQIVESPQSERLATGFEFTEGPLWNADGYWLFVDIRRSLIYRLAPGGQPEVYRDNSSGSNGLTYDLQGRLIKCEGDNQRISRREADGAITTLADRWEGKRLNRPNDVVGKSDGSIYFTNPVSTWQLPAGTTAASRKKNEAKPATTSSSGLSTWRPTGR